MRRGDKIMKGMLSQEEWFVLHDLLVELRHEIASLESERHRLELQNKALARELYLMERQHPVLASVARLKLAATEAWYGVR